MKLKTNTSQGFTLVELIVSFAIILLLASIAIPTYQKFIYRTKETEAYFMLRKIVDAQVTFVESGGHVLQSGDKCLTQNRFPRLNTHMHAGSWYDDRPPQGNKSGKRYFYSGQDLDGFYGSASANKDGLCISSGNNILGDRVDPWSLGLASEKINEKEDQGYYYRRGAYLDPGYFFYFADQSNNLKASLGTAHASMVVAVGDLDGQRPDDNSADLQWNNVDAMLGKEFYTILGRGVFIDNKGDAKALPGIFRALETRPSSD